MIRPAQLSDQETIVDFNLRLADETEDLRLDRARLEQGVAALLTDPHKGRYFVAELAREVVGQLMITYEWSDWRNGQVWWLQSVYVKQDFRRQGVFRALLEHLLAELDAAPDVVGLRLYVERHNASAQAVYERLQIVSSPYEVRQRLKTAY